MGLTTDSVIAIAGIVVTAVIALLGGIYAILTNTKKYELTEQYRRELLQWYSTVVTLMIQIIHACEEETFSSPAFSSQKTDMLARLSSLAEIGRFYFPNAIKNDGYGEKKPAAYRGYRHIYLELVLRFYITASNKKKDKNKVARLWELERHFTSAMFYVIDPRNRNHSYDRYLDISVPKGQEIQKYIDETRESLYND